jgi:hypothetical protein
MSDRLAVVTIANVYDENLGTKLTKLILGNATKGNAEVTEISGLKQAEALEYLDIQGMTKMNSVDLSNQKYFKTLKAKDSGISSVSFAKGAPVERIELPSSMRVLALNQLPHLDSNNIILENVANLQQINVSACPNVTDDFGFVYNWYTNKTSANATCSLVMDGVKWENVDSSQFLALCNLKLDGGVFNLKGKVSIPNATLAVVNAIKQVFNETVFLPDSELYIEIPESLVLEGPSRIANNRSGTFVATPIPTAGVSAPTFFLKIGGKEVQSISGVATINSTTGILSINANLASDTNLVVGAKFRGRDGAYIYSNEISVLAFVAVYPSSISILGDSKIYYKGYTYTYTLSVNPNNVNVSYGVSWSLPSNEYFKIASSDDTSCTLVVLKENTSQDMPKSLSATLTTDDGEVTLTTTKTVTLAKVVRPTSLVFGSANSEVRFVGEYTYTVTPNVAPSNVSLVYQTPTLSGDAVTQGKVSLGSASNGTIVVKVDAESTTDITFTINQKATISEGGAVIEGSKQVTLKSVIRPTGVTIDGPSSIKGGNTVSYAAIVTPSTTNIDVTYTWSISGSSNATIASQNGATCTVNTSAPDADETFTLTCTVNDGKKTISANRSCTVQEVKIGSWITIDQTISDPASMISGDVNGEHIRLIRENSHRYYGEYNNSDASMTIYQLDDTNSNLFANGKSASSYKNNRFMRLPRFWYKAIEKPTDIWHIGFYYGETAPDTTWKEWDGNDLIGAYRGVISGSFSSSSTYLMSQSGISLINPNNSSVNVKQKQWSSYATRNGAGFSLTKWKHHCVMCLLFYATYGTTDSSSFFGTSPSGNDTCGFSDNSGMTDIPYSARQTCFWGIEDWVSDKVEYFGNVSYSINAGDYWSYIVKEDDGTSRSIISPLTGSRPSGHISKMIIGEHLDMFPKEVSGTATTGYCSSFFGDTTGTDNVGRGSVYGSRGIAANQFTLNSNSNFRGRLAFRGTLIIKNGK